MNLNSSSLASPPYSLPPLPRAPKPAAPRHCARQREVTRPLVPPRKAGLGAGCCVRAAIAPDRRALARACAILSCDSKHRLAPTACPACMLRARGPSHPPIRRRGVSHAPDAGSGPDRAPDRAAACGATQQSHSLTDQRSKTAAVLTALWNEGPQPRAHTQSPWDHPQPPFGAQTRCPPPPPHPCGWAIATRAVRRVGGGRRDGRRGAAQHEALFFSFDIPVCAPHRALFTSPPRNRASGTLSNNLHTRTSGQKGRQSAKYVASCTVR